MDKNTRILVNPTGRFVVGGPHGDAGVTGRKIIVDTYGGAAPHGGGAFSGKDPTKVDRSACYMARYVAKNVVAAGLAERCLVQLAYAIGVAEPVSVLVDTSGTGKVSDDRISEIVREQLQAHAEGDHRNARTCAGRSTARPPRSATSAAASRSSPGSGPTRRRAARRRGRVSASAPRVRRPWQCFRTPHPMRRAMITTAAVLAAVFLLVLATLPPRLQSRPGRSTTQSCRRTVAGAFHVHSTRSDGAGDSRGDCRAAARSPASASSSSPITATATAARSA